MIRAVRAADGLSHLVVDPERFAVGHGEKGDAHLAAVAVHGSLDVHAHCRGALVQDGELRPVVEQSRHLPDNRRQSAGAQLDT